MFLFKLFKKKKTLVPPKPKYNIGDLVMWNNIVFYVNDYYFTKQGEMFYILYHPEMRMFYENIEENEIVKL